MDIKRLLLFYTLIFLANRVWAEAKAPWVGTSLLGTPCIGGGQGYGPFDYTKKKSYTPENLILVESAHFTPEVENLIKGNRGYLDSDIDYTLRAWPNHHRALLSITRYQLKIDNKLSNARLKTPVECYFQRALHFSPKDAISLSLYGYFLRKTGHLKAAVSAYEQALTLAPDTSKMEYAYSLLLIDLKQYDNALVYAKKAYQHGMPPQGLKNKLIKLGAWK
ncbi:tetratricopeptide repeat protein [Crenothrix polyspora]|uniref:TPR repeat-containing protein n=1 Tax=Crenothrix polyspora TaxID=360316 RepID=A0A1R4H6N5_9GAMM|nr:tetratricopeptide repeat protein [Crenothrix polyspora]SJM91701.1 TPR repeat-containing protein [Crenothrix polyspora]